MIKANNLSSIKKKTEKSDGVLHAIGNLNGIVPVAGEKLHSLQESFAGAFRPQPTMFTKKVMLHRGI